MIKACLLEFKGSWDDHMPLIDFAYKNRYHLSINMAPYDTLYFR